ncbi:hypothetical protein [uncultured Roseovarius sp.]|uniref:hypothetical protein n=1 Tax=uncultured Roseovarius sp. TaxID=293344 RepID=UPI0025FF6D94|nr:hypothetical protein [uncultured Roseovarius sp.]
MRHPSGCPINGVSDYVFWGAALPNPTGDKPGDETRTMHDISLLPPGQALQIQGVMGPAVHDTVFDVKVSWTEMPGASDRETLAYKIEAKDGFRGGWNTKGTHHVAEELEKIRKKLPKA